jgi:hypothetical protein
MVWNRCAGFFCMHRVMVSASPGGSWRPALAARCATGSGSIVMCWVRMPMNESPWNGSVPLKHSYMITPTA